jgi:hypothetical protein
MTVARKIQEFLDARPLAYIKPDDYRGAQQAVLDCDQADVLAHFETRLQDREEEHRAQAIAGLAVLYQTDATETILRWLHDESVVVRWVICGCLHDFGDRRAQAGLLDLLKHDSDPQVRGAAANALGRLGGAEVLPELYRTSQIDREVDQLGYTPAYQAEDAISEILRGWVIRKIHGSPLRNFEEATLLGQLAGRVVVVEGIPFDKQGIITKTARYSRLPSSAFGFGWSTHMDLQTSLVSPFEIDVKYVDPNCMLRRVFIYQHGPLTSETNWSVHTILDPTALYAEV